MIARLLVRGVFPFYKRNKIALRLPFIAFSSTKIYNNKMEEISAKVEQVKIGKDILTQSKSKNRLLPLSSLPREKSRESLSLKPPRSRRNPRRRRLRLRRSRSPLLRTRMKSVLSSSVRSISASAKSPNAGRYLLPIPSTLPLKTSTARRSTYADRSGRSHLACRNSCLSNR